MQARTSLLFYFSLSCYSVQKVLTKCFFYQAKRGPKTSAEKGPKKGKSKQQVHDDDEIESDSDAERFGS